MWVSRSFMACGTGKIRICYGVRPKIFGHEFNLVWFPQRVTYPFSAILFFGLESQQVTNFLLIQKGCIMTGS
jgi:hypothetical protein